MEVPTSKPDLDFSRGEVISPFSKMELESDAPSTEPKFSQGDVESADSPKSGRFLSLNDILMHHKWANIFLRASGINFIGHLLSICSNYYLNLFS